MRHHRKLFSSCLVLSSIVEALPANTTTTAPDVLAPDVSPVLWVPGIASCMLEARIVNKADLIRSYPTCGRRLIEYVDKWKTWWKKGGWFPIYASKWLAGRFPSCWMLLLSLTIDEATGKIADSPGMEIRPRDFGGLYGAYYIADDGVGTMSIPLYKPIVSALEQAGWTAKHDEKAKWSGETFRFMNYDWRKYGNPFFTDGLFVEFKKLVEDTFNTTGKKVIIACHSMGCPVMHHFLAGGEFGEDASIWSFRGLTQQWKDTYIEKFAAFAGPFAGAPAPLNDILEQADFLAIPALGKWFPQFNEYIRIAIMTMPGFFSLMPSALDDTWGNSPFLISGRGQNQTNYTVDHLLNGTLLADISAASGRKSTTVKGCECESPCGISNATNRDLLLGVAPRPWCWTKNACGSTRR